MFKLIFFGILLYLLYKLVFEIVVPVSTVATQMKKQVEEMRKQQANAYTQQQAYSSNHASASGTQQTTSTHQKTSNTASNSDEYIDFEEVK